MKRSLVISICMLLAINSFSQLTVKQIQSKIDSLEVQTQTISSQLKVVNEEIMDYQFELKMKQFKEGKLKMYSISRLPSLLEKFIPKPIPNISLPRKFRAYYPIAEINKDDKIIIGDESDKLYWKSKGYWVHNGLGGIGIGKFKKKLKSEKEKF